MKYSKIFLLVFILFTLSSCKEETIFEVKFIYEDGLSNIVTVEESLTLIEPERPVREGFSFLGWFSDSSYLNSYNFQEPVSGNLVLYAKWEAQTYEITFNYGDDIEPDTIEMKYGDDLSSIYEVIDTLDFVVFYLDSNFTQKLEYLTMPAMDLQIYARVEYPETTITFMDDEQIVTSITQTYLTIVDIPILTKSGFDFLGWVDENGIAYLDQYMPIDDLTLYAVWEEFPLKVGIIFSMSSDSDYLYVNPVLEGINSAFLSYDGDLNIELVYAEVEGNYNSDYNLLTAPFEYLVESEQVNIIIDATFSFKTISYLDDLSFSYGIPVIRMFESNTNDEYHDNIFDMTNTNSLFISMLSSFISQEFNKNPFIVYNSNYSYLRYLASSMETYYDDNMTTYTSKSYYNSYDIDDILNQVSLVNDAILAFTFTDLNVVMGKVTASNISIPVITLEADHNVLSDYGSTYEKPYYYLTDFSIFDQRSFIQEFVDVYEQTFFYNNINLVALGYDAMNLILSTFNQTDNYDYTSLINVFNSATYNNTLTGIKGFDLYGDPIRTMVVIVVNEGTEEVLDYIDIN